MPQLTTVLSYATCVSQLSNNQGYAFANAATPSTDARCFHVLLDGPSNLIRVYWGGTTAFNTVSAAGGSFDDGQFHSVAVTTDGSFLDVYVDAVQVSHTAITQPVSTCPGGIALIGARPPLPGSLLMNGVIGSSILTNYVLSSAELTTLKSQCQASSKPAL